MLRSRALSVGYQVNIRHGVYLRTIGLIGSTIAICFLIASCGSMRLNEEQYARWCHAAGVRIAEGLYDLEGWDAFASVLEDVATDGKRLSPPISQKEQHEAYVAGLHGMANPPFFVEWAIKELFSLLLLAVDLTEFIGGGGREGLIRHMTSVGLGREAVASTFSLTCTPP